MSQNKRFTYMEQFNGFYDVYDNGKIISCMRLEYVENTVNLLNRLNDKNHNLRESRRELITANNQYSRKLTELSDEKEQLKSCNEKAINFILDGIVEMHDGKRDYAEKLFNKAIEVIK